MSTKGAIENGVFDVKSIQNAPKVTYEQTPTFV